MNTIFYSILTINMLLYTLSLRGSLNNNENFFEQLEPINTYTPMPLSVALGGSALCPCIFDSPKHNQGVLGFKCPFLEVFNPTLPLSCMEEQREEQKNTSHQGKSSKNTLLSTPTHTALQTSLPHLYHQQEVVDSFSIESVVTLEKSKKLTKKRKRARASRKGNKKHVCLHCRKEFVTPSALDLHMYIHSGKRPHECPECQKTFNQLQNLKRHASGHVVKHHPNLSLLPYSCIKCEYRALKSCSLKSHLNGVHRN